MSLVIIIQHHLELQHTKRHRITAPRLTLNSRWKAFTVNNFATFFTGGGEVPLNSRKNGANGNITANLNSYVTDCITPIW